jgi:hypothetical protein
MTTRILRHGFVTGRHSRQPEDRDKCNIQNIDIAMNPHNWLCPKHPSCLYSYTVSKHVEIKRVILQLPDLILSSLALEGMKLKERSQYRVQQNNELHY